MIEMNAVEILKAAKDLISIPSRWCTGYYACDSEGNATEFALDPNAASWCVLGAIRKVSNIENDEMPLYDLLSHIVEEKNSEWSPSMFNDNSKHSEVIELLEIAIARAELEDLGNILIEQEKEEMVLV